MSEYRKDEVMGDERRRHVPDSSRWAGGAGAGSRRWPLPDRGRAPVEPAGGKPSECFAPVEARPVAGPLTRPEFGTVRRGYDPGQVDEYVEALSAQAAAVDTERRRADIAEDQLRDALVELKRVRRDAVPTPPDRAEPSGSSESSEPPEPSEGFGFRVERMLREAEREAEQERRAAVEQAAEILARARADAESHRRGVERSLSERTVAKDDELRGREADLAGRERDLVERLSAARAEAAAIIREAEDVASLRVREMLDDAAREAAAERDRVSREVRRLTEVRRTVRVELADLHRDLGRLGAGTDAGDDGVPGADGTDQTVAPEQRTATEVDRARPGVEELSGSVRA